MDTQNSAEQITKQVAALNDDLKHVARQRLKQILEEATGNALALAVPWRERELYRLEADRRNAELAAEIARLEEEAAAAAAADGKKGKPEKRKSITAKPSATGSASKKK
jgi:hypothetical protein